MAHFNFVISQNAKWGHAGFYIDCHRMTVPENILLQKKALAVLDIYAAIKSEQSQDGETKLSGKAISDTLLQTVGKESENWV